MYLVIDIGGTKTLIALFNRHGRVIKKYKFKTPVQKTEFLAILKSALVPFSVHFGTKIVQVVVAVPGLVEQNIATKFGNRPWKNLDLARELKNLFSCPIDLMNDANLATIYESSFHRGLSLFLTFSTGIGGGLARRGKLARNSSLVEPGHTRYLFDNHSLEWEDIASCQAIGQAYDCQATSVRGAAAYQDIAARVALGLPDLIQEYHPDCIIIGGPLGKLFRHIKAPLRKELRTQMPKRSKIPRLAAPKRPNESVIYGGYLYASHLKR